jgi:hypothetical protein
MQVFKEFPAHAAETPVFKKKDSREGERDDVCADEDPKGHAPLYYS